MKNNSISDELIEIKGMNKGLLIPSMVVDYARNENTHLHKKFTWDDSEAAEKYRIWQARHIISLELVVVRLNPGGKALLVNSLEIEKENKDKPVRAFVSLPLDRHSEDYRGYRSIADIMNDKDLREQLLESAREDMAIFRRKYGMLEKLAKVFSAMDAV